MKVILVVAGLITAAAAHQARAEGVDQFCAERWPTDFAIREYCIQKENRAAADLSGRSFDLPPDWREATTALCRQRWPREPSMVLYCLESQEKAAAGITTIVNKPVPKDVALTIMTECEKQWRPDIEMFSQCIGKQAEAWHRLNR